MTAETAISRGALAGMMADINRLRASLADEASQSAEEWERLGAIGGQRADDAAALLGRLRPAFQAMAKYCSDCDSQITAMMADPFDRKPIAIADAREGGAS